MHLLLHPNTLPYRTSKCLKSRQNNLLLYMNIDIPDEDKSKSEFSFPDLQLVQWSGRLKMRSSSQPGGYAMDGMICICRPMQTNSILEINLDGNMFMSRHDLGMRFTFCDPRYTFKSLDFVHNVCTCVILCRFARHIVIVISLKLSYFPSSFVFVSIPLD